ncbi:maleylpyruvate isomerase N-terminal domain-containing protein [Actinoplanes sp. LDG1-06]|uniref:Maleylpyruvate isomerase N-terminal domain-containing protein n=1 Tax=Paractinoplanes ovalisporus TaxID=2810368 RepID=A0ABS2AHT8_9ACTN|nr:maleylpyruvate isomerase N-terminal domain-containing protein [Actinoplanes ovalisporus]
MGEWRGGRRCSSTWAGDGTVAAVAGRRAALLEPLTDAEWHTPSLCTAWRVRDVAAHADLAPQSNADPPARSELRP